MKLRTTALMFALAAGGVIAGDAAAQNQRAGIVTVATGRVTVARPPAPTAPLKFRDALYLRDMIATGQHSLARILLGGKAVVTLSEMSVVTITEVPGRSIIDLSAGRIALAVARERMMPGDTVEIRTPVAVAGVRGTVVVAEVVPGNAPGSTPVSRFTVLKGLVEVTALDARTQLALSRSTLLAARQAVTADERGIAMPRTISPEAAERLGAAFRTPPAPAPAHVNAVTTEAQLEKAAEIARAALAQDNRDRANTPAPVEARAEDDEHGDGDAGASGTDRQATPKGDVPRVETPKAEAPKADAPGSDAPKLDVSKSDTPKVDAPKSDAPKADTPKGEAPKLGAPKGQAPGIQLPKADVPKVDVPKVEVPKVEVPKVDVPKADVPKVEAHKGNLNHGNKGKK